MSEEEKKAIESLRKNRGVSFAQADIILNLIDKQQKEIEYLKGQIPQDKIFYYSEKEYISKDKIRALIEQLEDVLDLAESEKRFPKYRKQALIEEINDLQELLDE